jgi:uncharacterized protein (TIRG00374 family)
MVHLAGTGTQKAFENMTNKMTHPTPAYLRSWQFWLGLLVSLACLALSLREIDFNQAARILTQVNGWWLGFAVLSVLATLVIKAVRWQWLFAREKTPSFRRAFTIQGIGMLLNTFAPARVGDLARAYLMGKAEDENTFYIFGTVVVEKLLDLVFLLLTMVILLTQVVFPAWLVNSANRFALGGGIGIFLVVLLVWKGENLLRWTTNRLHLLPHWCSREFFEKQARFGLLGFQVLGQPRQLFWALSLSFASWVAAGLTNYLTFASLGLKMPIVVSLFLLFVLQAGLSLPSSPGRIGVFHYLTIITLLFFSVDRDTALSCAMILHLVVIGPIGLVGIACLWMERITWTKLEKRVSVFRFLLKRQAKVPTLP